MSAPTHATLATLVTITSQGVVLPGTLTVPTDASGVVLFAHGSGSSRRSPRNVQVAQALHEVGFATLLFDLLTAGEDRDYAMRFNIALLAERLLAATDFVAAYESVAALPMGYFGASTGAAAALMAAAGNRRVAAIVSRGGRPDLIPPAVLAQVSAATLLIVGGADPEVLALNRMAYRDLRGAKSLAIVPDATHLFEEIGALDAVIGLARDWFQRWLGLGAPS